MIRIAICDDEINARQVLKFGLWKALSDSDKEQTIYEFPSGEKTIDWIKKNPASLDVLFLDIEMDGMDGMETKKKIRQFNDELVIVFVTGYADYVFDGYSVGALDYIMKPVKHDKLKDVIKRVYALIYTSEPELFTVENTSGLFRIPIRDIVYFKSDSHRLILVTPERTYEFYGKLNDLEDELGKDFIRVHQRYLINISKIDKILDNNVMVQSHNIPMSRGRKKQVMTEITKRKLSHD